MRLRSWERITKQKKSLPQRWTSTSPGRIDVSTTGAFRYFRTLAEPTVGGISLNADDFLVRELPSLEAEYPGGRRASHRAGGSGGNATPASTIPCVVTKSSPSSNLPITWALTRSKVRTRPGSNVDPRVHARAPLVRTDLEFEHFDHVGSQISSAPSSRGGRFEEPRSRSRS